MPMRIMTAKPLNAETPIENLRSWLTPNEVFFDRNQGEIPEKPIELSDWELIVQGEVKKELHFDFEAIRRMPKTIVSNTFECSGNGRSLLSEKASGNPWTIGGVGNAVWGGVWLRDILEQAGLKETGKHIAFEGFEKALGSSGIKFIRSIPVDKAMTSTLLTYEMNGEPLPHKHGYPMRVLALGWYGTNNVKWLNKITVMDKPYEGFFMDTVYRVYQKGEDPKAGKVMNEINVKSIITQPIKGESLPPGKVVIMGVAYAGERDVVKIEVSLDAGKAWQEASFIGPHEPYAWRQWQYVWDAREKGVYTIVACATDSQGKKQPIDAAWNVLGYGNNGMKEHAVTVNIE